MLTNLSGLYRYKTGDVIKIVKNDSKGIFFEFCFRKNLFLNIAGEKTYYKQIERVIKKIEEMVPNILEYSLGATIYENIGTYFLFLALPDNQKNVIDLDKIKKEFDLMLCKVNYVYDSLRKLDCLGEPKVFLLDKEKYFKIFKNDPNIKCHNKPKYILSQKLLNQIKINF